MELLLALCDLSLGKKGTASERGQERSLRVYGTRLTAHRLNERG